MSYDLQDIQSHHNEKKAHSSHK